MAKSLYLKGSTPSDGRDGAFFDNNCLLSVNSARLFFDNEDLFALNLTLFALMFPCWELFIPSLGTKHSLRGNKKTAIFKFYSCRTHYVRRPSYLCTQKLKIEGKDMKQDKDLLFLASCQNEDLRTLCDFLIYNKKGELRMSEQLSNSDAFLRHYPERMNLMATELSEELRKYGSNTIKTLYRHGEADSYETIVRRVCSKMDVEVSEYDSVPMMERQLMTEVCEQFTSRLSDDELHQIADETGIVHKNLKRQALVYALMTAVRHNAMLLSRMVYYVITYMAELLLGRCVTMVGLGTVGRYIGVATGPIGWAFLAGWTINDIASPAYRVMIPAVMMIASMRIRQTALLPQKI